jgi:hypothetical protein
MQNNQLCEYVDGSWDLSRWPALACESECPEVEEMGRRIVALEHENGSLQQLICYLLTKNEALRNLLYAGQVAEQ